MHAVSVALATLAFGCAHHHPDETLRVIPAEQHLSVHLDATFHTKATHGSEEIASFAPWTDTACALDTTVSITNSRVFRDGSLGSLLRFDAARLATKDGQALPFALEGRTVELRRFPDGELLDVDLAEHIVGPDRLGGVFDLLFPIVAPFPPDIAKKGDKAMRSLAWPVVDEDRHGWYERAQLEWTLEQTEEVAGMRAIPLRYEGPWTASGKDAVGTVPVVLAAHGRVSGVVWYDEDTLDLVAQEFHWQRQVTWTAGRGEAATVVTQDQEFVGKVGRP